MLQKPSEVTDLVYLAAPVGGWLVAQAVKYVLFLKKNGFQARDLFQSGGMPSAHVCFFAALSTAIAINDGLYTPVFALSVGLTAVILYDSMGVRRATGQQTKAIEFLYKKTGTKNGPQIIHADGHNLQEVLVGLLLGVIVGAIISWIAQSI